MFENKENWNGKNRIEVGKTKLLVKRYGLAKIRNLGYLPF
jgi:hypothetical protein